MGRHTNPVPEEDLVQRSPLATWSARVAIAVVLILAFGAGIGLSFLDTGKLSALLPGKDAETGCPAVPVSLVVVPELEPVLRDLLAPLDQQRVEGGCLDVDVRAQDPVQTIASASVLPRDRMPQLWIPDSSLWLQRADRLRATQVGSIATSPVVVAASPADAAALTSAGTWARTLDGSRSLALLHPDSSAVGLLALRAVADTAASSPAAAVAATVHAVKLDGSSTSLAAIQAVRRTGPNSTRIAVVSEQTVVNAQAGWSAAELVPVYPQPGSPVLDYPLTRVSEARWTPAQEAGADLVVRTLTGAPAVEALRAAGFRSGDGTAGGTGPVQVPERVEPLPLPSNEDLEATAGMLRELAPPTRMLAVLDVSMSMTAPVDGGQTRAELVRDVVKVAATALTDDARVGLWLFASQLDGDRDYKELAPIRRLDTPLAGGLTQRDLMTRSAQQLPNRLVPGGTSLYDTTYAAVAQMVHSYEPDASNVVVIITDGVNEDSAGLNLKQAQSRLRAITRDKPVRVIAIAVGPDTDVKALGQLAAASANGKAYQVMKAQDLQAVLFDALSSRN